MIGDVLTSSVMFEMLKDRYPNAQLHYLINSHTYPVVQHHPHIDEFVFVTPKIEHSYIAFYRFLKQIRKQRYDAVIDVYGKLSSHFITVFSGAKIKIGYRKKQSRFIFTHNIQRIKKPQHNASLAIENRLRLLAPLHIEFKQCSPKIYLQPEELTAANTLLAEQGIDLDKPLYMISVLGSNRAKTYPAAYMAQLLDAIVEEKGDAQLLFNYIPKQEKEAREIYNLTKPNTQQQIFFDLFGKSLREFLALTAHCGAMIGNEGGAVNMAKALNIPTFIIFSPHLNKANWFGEVETGDHQAVHMSDFIDHYEADVIAAKSSPEAYYLKFKPTFIEPKLKAFVKNH